MLNMGSTIPSRASLVVFLRDGDLPIGQVQFLNGDPCRSSLLPSPDQESQSLLAAKHFTFYLLHIAWVGWEEVVLLLLAPDP